jgi:ribosomal 50S subunit-recycling heat shock protein
LRLDVFLKRTGLVKQRTQAKLICDRGRVAVDGNKAKAGKEIGAGRVIGLDLSREYIEIEVLELPDRNFKRQPGEAFYRVVRHEEKDRYS